MAQPVRNDVIIHGKNIEIHALTNNIAPNRYASFELDFIPSLILTDNREHPEMKNSKEDEWEVGLLRTSVWNSMKNVLASLGNNTIRFLIGVVVHTITLQDGTYQLQSINDEINYYLSSNGISANKITFVPHTPTGKVLVVIAPTVSIDFTHASNIGLGLLLGFVGQNLNNVGLNNLITLASAMPRLNYYGPNSILVEVIHVRIDIINHRVYANNHLTSTATKNDILYKFSLNSSPSSLQVERVDNQHYIKIRQSNEIKSIRYIFTNQDGIELPLENEATIQIQLRRSMDYRVQSIVNNTNNRYS